MKYNELATPSKNRKRSGRGISAGRGKTAGRGTKGQNSRTGGGVRPGFEGGQNPLIKRIPKMRGFKSKRTPIQNIYTKDLEAFGGKTVDNAMLEEAGLIESRYIATKVIANGDLTAKVTVNIAGASAGAVTMIEKAGGSFTKTATPMREKTSKK